MDTRPLATDVSKAKSVVTGFGRTVASVKVGVSDVASNMAASMGRTVLMFLTVEKVLGKIRHAFTELDKKDSPIRGMLTQQELAGALSFRDAIWDIGTAIDVGILKALDRIAPAFITAGNNAASMVAPLLGAKKALDAIEMSVNFISAQWANLQQIVSGIALQWYAVSKAMLPTDQFSLIVQGKFDELEQSVKSTLDLFEEGQAMFDKGLSGKAGADVLKQIEAERKKIDSTVFINADLDKLKAAAKEVKANLPDISPGALQKGSAASVSAILKIQRGEKQKETEKLLKEQIKVLKQIERKGNRVEIVAIL